MLTDVTLNYLKAVSLRMSLSQAPKAPHVSEAPNHSEMGRRKKKKKHQQSHICLPLVLEFMYVDGRAGQMLALVPCGRELGPQGVHGQLYILWFKMSALVTSHGLYLWAPTSCPSLVSFSGP